MPAGQRPPLSCRTSPPQVGRSDVATVSRIFNVEENAPASKLPISPLFEGGMPGRAEGGAAPPASAPSSRQP
ncbi:hypothetical protein FJW08_29910 [Mesorhizobium sp. B3-2-1]|nr:hypothetical protein FJW08_29910 [Mesorhizobium sp. B3-2-1]